MSDLVLYGRIRCGDYQFLKCLCENDGLMKARSILLGLSDNDIEYLEGMLCGACPDPRVAAHATERVARYWPVISCGGLDWLKCVCGRLRETRDFVSAYSELELSFVVPIICCESPAGGTGGQGGGGQGGAGTGGNPGGTPAPPPFDEDGISNTIGLSADQKQCLKLIIQWVDEQPDWVWNSIKFAAEGARYLSPFEWLDDMIKGLEVLADYATGNKSSDFNTPHVIAACAVQNGFTNMYARAAFYAIINIVLKWFNKDEWDKVNTCCVKLTDVILTAPLNATWRKGVNRGASYRPPDEAYYEMIEVGNAYLRQAGRAPGGNQPPGPVRPPHPTAEGGPSSEGNPFGWITGDWEFPKMPAPPANMPPTVGTSGTDSVDISDLPVVVVPGGICIDGEKVKKYQAAVDYLRSIGVDIDALTASGSPISSEVRQAVSREVDNARAREQTNATVVVDNFGQPGVRRTQAVSGDKSVTMNVTINNQGVPTIANARVDTTIEKLVNALADRSPQGSRGTSSSSKRSDTRRAAEQAAAAGGAAGCAALGIPAASGLCAGAAGAAASKIFDAIGWD